MTSTPWTAAKFASGNSNEDAVAREDYDEAKRLRDGINRLKAVGAKVAQLEHRKRSAIEAEDYDAAKVIKMEIDKLREAGIVAVGETVGAGMGGAGGGPERIFNRALEAERRRERRARRDRRTISGTTRAPTRKPSRPRPREDRRPVMEDYTPRPSAPPPAADEPTPVKYEPRA